MPGFSASLPPVFDHVPDASVLSGGEEFMQDSPVVWAQPSPLVTENTGTVDYNTWMTELKAVPLTGYHQEPEMAEGRATGRSVLSRDYSDITGNKTLSYTVGFDLDKRPIIMQVALRSPVLGDQWVVLPTEAGIEWAAHPARSQPVVAPPGQGSLARGMLGAAAASVAAGKELIPTFPLTLSTGQLDDIARAAEEYLKKNGCGPLRVLEGSSFRDLADTLSQLGLDTLQSPVRNFVALGYKHGMLSPHGLKIDGLEGQTDDALLEAALKRIGEKHKKYSREATKTIATRFIACWRYANSHLGRLPIGAVKRTVRTNYLPKGHKSYACLGRFLFNLAEPPSSGPQLQPAQGPAATSAQLPAGDPGPSRSRGNATISDFHRGGPAGDWRESLETIKKQYPRLNRQEALEELPVTALADVAVALSQLPHTSLSKSAESFLSKPVEIFVVLAVNRDFLMNAKGEMKNDANWVDKGLAAMEKHGKISDTGKRSPMTTETLRTTESKARRLLTLWRYRENVLDVDHFPDLGQLSLQLDSYTHLGQVKTDLNYFINAYLAEAGSRANG